MDDICSNYISNIRKSGLSIYDTIERGDPNLWIPTCHLETILNEGLVGISLSGLPLRTRSKTIKEAVCRALGYPIPQRFTKTQPRFPGQDFDTYGQKANNLQIWNEEISLYRRYVMIRISPEDRITKVRVLAGSELEKYDTTGTLTQKFQARLNVGTEKIELISKKDTTNLLAFTLSGEYPKKISILPSENPSLDALLPIDEICRRLTQLVGYSFRDTGFDQERNRGANLQQIVCNALGYEHYRDNGQFPDIRNQLIEVKLQTSPTIDLGLVKPDSEEFLDISICGRYIRHCDVRYVIFNAVIENGRVVLKNLYITSGQDFFGRFPQFQGKVTNKKIQLALPDNFFDL